MALAGIRRTTQVLRFFKFSQCSINFLTETKHQHAQYLFLVNNVQCKYLSTNKQPQTPGKPGDPKSEDKSKKKKALTSPQITLIVSDVEVHAMTMEQAEKISKRRNLKLVKIVDFDTKTQRPVYKLMTALEFFDESTKMKQRKKREKDATVKELKLFTMSCKIGDHDLESKIRMMFKLLKKRHEVRVLISHDRNPTRAEEIRKLIEEELTEISSSKESSTKSNTLKLIIKPKLETGTTASETDTTSNKKVEEPSVNKNDAAKNVKK